MNIYRVEKTFNNIFQKIKKEITNSIDNKDVESAIKYIQCISKLNFTFYFEYYNQVIEDDIAKISKLIFPNSINYIPQNKNIAFIDTLAWDNHGLTQQYLRAMMDNEFNILYIVIGKADKCKKISDELNNYALSKIIVIDANIPLKAQIKLINKEIYDYKPLKVFLHSFSIIDAIALKSLDTPDKYRIDLGDHHCWYGSSATDYIVEFRNWGYTLTNSFRGVLKEKIIQLPYYPINDENKYEGLPVVNKNQVVIFSGGALYKFIDNKNTFLNLMHKILIENPNSIIAFACRGNDNLLKRFIKKNKLEKRLLLIGYRKDIFEVFKHIDIHLDTYPETGGLMQQYAALNCKPILSYCTHTNKYNATINFNETGTYKTRYTNIEELLKEANRLICDSTYRSNIGNWIKNYVIDRGIFAIYFKQIFYENKCIYSNDNVEYNFKSFRINSFTSSVKFKFKDISSILYYSFSIKYLYLFFSKVIIVSSIIAVFKKITNLIPMSRKSLI